MRTSADFRELVSGECLGTPARLCRWGLQLVEIPYALAMQYRNRRYDRGRAEIHRATVPVVSVGNLTLGGTGKTPMVAWLASWFRNQGIRVAIISRGYAARRGAQNDEAQELARRLPDVPHVQNPDRVQAARDAVTQFDSQILLVDDGFQHRRLHRDLDIVLIDALEPFGYGHVFPRGMLREPVKGIGRADVVVLTRAAMASDLDRQAIQTEIRRHAPEMLWLEADHQPTCLVSYAGANESLDRLQGQRLFAFCGIGNPVAFQRSLVSCQCEPVQFCAFADHHTYTAKDVANLEQAIQDWRADLVVCTHKDLVKIGLDRLANRDLWALQVEMQVRDPQQELEKMLRRLREIAQGDHRTAEPLEG